MLTKSEIEALRHGKKQLADYAQEALIGWAAPRNNLKPQTGSGAPAPRPARPTAPAGVLPAKPAMLERLHGMERAILSWMQAASE